MCFKIIGHRGSKIAISHQGRKIRFLSRPQGGTRERNRIFCPAVRILLSTPRKWRSFFPPCGGVLANKLRLDCWAEYVGIVSSLVFVSGHLNQKTVLPRIVFQPFYLFLFLLAFINVHTLLSVPPLVCSGKSSNDRPSQ